MNFESFLQCPFLRDYEIILRPLKSFNSQDEHEATKQTTFFPTEDQKMTNIISIDDYDTFEDLGEKKVKKKRPLHSKENKCVRKTKDNKLPRKKKLIKKKTNAFKTPNITFEKSVNTLEGNKLKDSSPENYAPSSLDEYLIEQLETPNKEGSSYPSFLSDFFFTEDFNNINTDSIFGDMMGDEVCF